MPGPNDALARVWRSVKLCIRYHRDRDGNRRQKPWNHHIKDAQVAIHPDPSRREAVVLVEGNDPEPTNDVSIRVRPDRILLHREAGSGWEVIAVENGEIVVLVNGIWVWINADGSVRQDKGEDSTRIDADGTVAKTTAAAEALMSADGVELSRRTATAIAAIREDGVIARFPVVSDAEQVDSESGEDHDNRIEHRQDS